MCNSRFENRDRFYHIVFAHILPAMSSRRHQTHMSPVQGAQCRHSAEQNHAQKGDDRIYGKSVTPHYGSHQDPALSLAAISHFATKCGASSEKAYEDETA